MQLFSFGYLVGSPFFEQGKPVSGAVLYIIIEVEKNFREGSE